MTRSAHSGYQIPWSGPRGAGGERRI